MNGEIHEASYIETFEEGPKFHMLHTGACVGTGALALQRILEVLAATCG